MNFAAAGHNGPGSLYLTKGWTNSSLLRPNTEVIRGLEWGDDHDVVREVEVPCVTIDTASRNSGTLIDFIKVDTQGTELDILKGAEEQLQHVTCVEVEVEFCEVYQGQALFAEVDTFLREQGFYLHEMGNILTIKPRGQGGRGGAKGRLVSADALYFRTAPSQGFSPHQLRALFLAYLVYGYSEEALSQLEQHGEIIAPRARSGVIEQLRSLSTAPRFLQRAPGWTAVCRIGKKLWQASPAGASHWDRPLGNDL